MKLKAPVVVLLLCAFSGCYYDSEEYLYPQINNDCDTINITFSLSVKPVINGYCLSCHSNNTAASLGGNIKLEHYPDVKQRADDGSLWGSISHASGYSPMPKGASKLDQCKLTNIQKWIQVGAPNT